MLPASTSAMDGGSESDDESGSDDGDDCGMATLLSLYLVIQHWMSSVRKDAAMPPSNPIWVPQVTVRSVQSRKVMKSGGEARKSLGMSVN